MNPKEMEAVISELRSHDDFLITSHINPEGDSVGSQLAVLHALKSIGKRAYVVNQDWLPDNLKFLPGCENVNHELPEGFEPRTAVFLDCPVKERVGSIARHIDDSVFIVNIDHHVSNEYYGDVNWVEPRMSSVGEMLFHMMKKMGVEMTSSVVQYLYTAIITDTGMFNYDSTTGQTHEIIGELVKMGIKPRFMHNEIFEKKSLTQVKVLGKVLTTVKSEENGLMVYIVLTKDMVKEEGVQSVSTEEFINYPRSIKDVEVALFFNENVNVSGAVNVSFRSNGRVDVNRIASAFGGGGHRNASGCLLRCPLEEAKEKVLAETRKAVKEISGK